MQPSPVAGRLGHAEECTFTIERSPEGTTKTVLTDALEALYFGPVASAPNLFALLLNYLESQIDFCPCKDEPDKGCGPGCSCCCKELTHRLKPYQLAGTRIQISLAQASFIGYIYRIDKCILYLVDNPTEPTALYAVPLCKILSFEPQ